MISKVLAIIVDFKSPQDAESLSIQVSAQKLVGPEFGVVLQVIHFDNGNTPSVVLSERQKSHKVLCERSESNLGYAGALDEVIQRYKKQGLLFDAYWFLNSDLSLGPDCLRKLLQVLNLHPQVGAVGPRIKDSRVGKLESQPIDKIWGARGWISPMFGTTGMGDWKGGILPSNSYIPGCSLLVRAEAYHQIGGMSLDYHLYYEETELCVRLKKGGWDLWVERGALVYHRVDSMKNGTPARHFAYYFIRNNLLFWKRNYGFPIWLQLPRTMYVLLREVIAPLRRAKSLSEVWDRIQYSLAGIWDGILVAGSKPPVFERRLFK
jgi:GT2 family glycosyltransferase